MFLACSMPTSVFVPCLQLAKALAESAEWAAAEAAANRPPSPPLGSPALVACTCVLFLLGGSVASVLLC